MMVYLISPFLNKGLDGVDRNTFKNMLIVMTIFEVMPIITLSPNSGSNFYGLLYIYLLARYFNRYNISIKSSNAVGLFLICFLLLWFLVHMSSMMFTEKPYCRIGFRILGYNNPLCIVMAVMLFYLPLNMKPWSNRTLNKAYNPILAVYVVTETMGVPFYSFIANQMKDSPIHGIALMTVTMTGCLLVGHLALQTTSFVNKIIHR